MRKLTIALSAATVVFSGSAIAQASPTAGPARMEKPDMTRAQAQAQAEAMFARMDTNGDGAIDQTERAAMKQMRPGGGKPGMKRGGHGAHGTAAMDAPLTKQAFVARSLAMFDRADADRNGTVTQAERKAARDTMRQQWQARKESGEQG